MYAECKKYFYICKKKMGLGKNAMVRFMIIDQVVAQKYMFKPNMQRIIEVCNQNGIDVSSETIQKDINMMKKPKPHGIGAPLKFCFREQEYYYTDPNFSFSTFRLSPEEINILTESTLVLKCMLRTGLGDKLRHALERVLSTTLESNSRDERYPIIQTMEPPPFRGYEFMDLFIEACRYNIPLSFVHYSYEKERFKSIILHPYVVREFNNRWYVFGYSENHNEMRSFGMDRIYDPLRLSKHFIHGNSKLILNYLDNMYGIFPIGDNEVQEVILHADPLLTKYLAAYKIHKTQNITKNRFGNSEISFKLIPTMEFIQWIWSNGPRLTLVSPRWLVEKEIRLRKHL